MSPICYLGDALARLFCSDQFFPLNMKGPAVPDAWDDFAALTFPFMGLSVCLCVSDALARYVSLHFL